MNQRVEQIYRDESRRVLATLIRLLGDFELAEEAMHEAFAVALSRWESAGVPANPRAWPVSTGRFKAIDHLRNQARHDARLTELATHIETTTPTADPTDDEMIRDDRLRLIFTCCHPALGVEAQLALTFREVCGLATEEVARAFLCRPATIAQRIVRAKAK
jgi:RNA polymerase sigma-70 factor (ECF subfamily)